MHYFEFDAGYFSDWFGFGYSGHPPVRTISINKIGDQFRFNIAVAYYRTRCQKVRR